MSYSTQERQFQGQDCITSRLCPLLAKPALSISHQALCSQDLDRDASGCSAPAGWRFPCRPPAALHGHQVVCFHIVGSNENTSPCPRFRVTLRGCRMVKVSTLQVHCAPVESDHLTFLYHVELLCVFYSLLECLNDISSDVLELSSR